MDARFKRMLRALGARMRVPSAAVALALIAAGCGPEDPQPDGSQQAATLTISAAIAPGGVTVSPSHFPAATIELLASNQTSTTRRLELRSRRMARGAIPLVQRTGPIPPGGTASLKADVRAGSYLVSAPGSGIAPDTILATAPRAGTQGGGLLAP